MAEYATLHQQSVIKIDAGIPMESAALVGCAVTTGVGAVLNTAKIEPGATVVVIGAGGVGLNVIQGAVLAGANKVIAVDMAEEKLAFAKIFGATDVINPKVDEPVAKVKKGFGGADYVFECIGLAPTIEQSFAMLKKGGMAVVVGIPASDQKISLPAAHFPFAEKIITGSMYGSTRPRVDFPKFFDLYRSKRLKLDELVTARYRIEDVNQAFDDMKKNARGVIVFD
jgi:S-(hydroxymethyl)glutathione dehydrogenase/alcohol dehydrogenase